MFAGTGVVGLEALSRGASLATFVERDVRLAKDIDAHLVAFNLTRQGQVVRTDVYRWAERWRVPTGPVNVFLSPPFPDLSGVKLDEFLALVATLYAKMPAGSVLAVQAELGFPAVRLPDPDEWDVREYSRNLLLFRVKAGGPERTEPEVAETPESDPDIGD